MLVTFFNLLKIRFIGIQINWSVYICFVLQSIFIIVYRELIKV